MSVSVNIVRVGRLRSHALRQQPNLHLQQRFVRRKSITKSAPRFLNCLQAKDGRWLAISCSLRAKTIPSGGVTAGGLSLVASVVEFSDGQDFW
jgi:hypothetical protein